MPRLCPDCRYPVSECDCVPEDEEPAPAAADDQPADPRPLVIGIAWAENGKLKQEVYGPWVSAADDSHLESLGRFVVAWQARTGITPVSAVLFLCIDPDEWLAGRVLSAARLKGETG